jgi:hypothetical protein
VTELRYGALKAGPPEAPEVAVFDPDRAIQKRSVCGGLINEYRQAA